MTLPFPPFGLSSKPAAMTVMALEVTSVFRQENANVHLVGFFFQPLEKGMNAIPFVVTFTMLGISLPNITPVFFRKLFPWNLGINSMQGAYLKQVVQAVTINFSFKWLDRSLIDGKGVIGYDQIRAYFDGFAKTLAIWTGADGGIEGKGIRPKRLEFTAGFS